MDAAKLSHRPGTCATTEPRKQHLQNAKAGRKAWPRCRSIWTLDLGQRHLRHRAAFCLGPRRRAPLRLRPHRGKLLRFRRDGAFEELEPELVAPLLVFVDDHAHMASALKVAEQD